MPTMKCEQCGKQFGSEHGLNIHVGRRHGRKAKAKHGRKNTARRLGGRRPAGLDVSGLTIDQLLSLKGAVDGRLAEIGQMIRQAKVDI